MNMLTRKDVKQWWRKEQQQVFDKLKKIFTIRPVLVVLDLDKEFRVEVEVSNYTTGEVLSMKYSNKLWRPVTFISESLSNIERNYKIHNKEMLVIVRCLEVWKYFLKRIITKFKI